MGSDEDRAFEVLRRNREIHVECIHKFKGNLIKEIGDGILVSFDQASAAVLCAIKLEQASKELDIQLKIGIHEGEVIFEDGDVFGDGVNIASRLQSIADPGGIYISESLQKSIRGKRNIHVKYLGKHDLKNVDYPVKTYAVQGLGLPVPVTSRIKRLFWVDWKQRKYGSILQLLLAISIIVILGRWIQNSFFSDAKTKPTLIVLPVSDFTSDTQDWFVDGVHASMVGEIQKISGIQVISDWSSRLYKNSDKPILEIATEMNANFVATASFLSIGIDLVRDFRLHYTM